jgi:hypothetical protein
MLWNPVTQKNYALCLLTRCQVCGTEGFNVQASGLGNGGENLQYKIAALHLIRLIFFVTPKHQGSPLTPYLNCYMMLSL